MSLYLVTGVAGFIASRVAGQLLAAGHAVVGLDNLNDYYDVRLKDYRLAGLMGETAWRPGASPRQSQYGGPARRTAGEGRFIFEAMDIEDRAGLERIFSEFQFDAVFNLAARAGVGYSVENPHVYLTTNAHGTLNLLECQRRHGVRKMVLASTSSLYAGCPMPFTEEQPVNTPLSPYAATKKAAELLAHSYHQLHGLDISVVRYFTVFGPAGRPDMSIFRFMRWMDNDQPLQLYGDGRQSRDFTFVEDIARGTILAAKSVGYEIINLGGGRQPVSLQSVIARLEKIMGRTARISNQPPQTADIMETWAEIAKAERLLGWRPVTMLDDGLAKTWEWYQASTRLAATGKNLTPSFPMNTSPPDNLTGKSVLVTGGTGSFGKAFVAALLREHPGVRRVVVYSRDELKQFDMAQTFPQTKDGRIRYFIGDVRDGDRLRRACEGVDIIVHAAALKQVPTAEYNPMECIKTNIYGAEHVVEAALDLAVETVVALSTDKAAAPINLYGATKLCSDKLFIAANNFRGKRKTRFSVVRYGNVLGSRGSVIPFFLERRRTGTLPITDPRMTRFNISLTEGVALVRHAIEAARGGEIFVPKIPSYRILDVAEAIGPGCKRETVGIRPGEKIHEEMITESDSFSTVDCGPHFAILSPNYHYTVDDYIAQTGARRVIEGFRYNSGENTDWLSVEQLRELIREQLDPSFQPT